MGAAMLRITRTPSTVLMGCKVGEAILGTSGSGSESPTHFHNVKGLTVGGIISTEDGQLHWKISRCKKHSITELKSLLRARLVAPGWKMMLLKKQKTVYSLNKFTFRIWVNFR